VAIFARSRAGNGPIIKFNQLFVGCSSSWLCLDDGDGAGRDEGALCIIDVALAQPLLRCAVPGPVEVSAYMSGGPVQ
jgi:hypothetical protein